MFTLLTGKQRAVLSFCFEFVYRKPNTADAHCEVTLQFFSLMGMLTAEELSVAKNSMKGCFLNFRSKLWFPQSKINTVLN